MASSRKGSASSKRSSSKSKGGGKKKSSPSPKSSSSKKGKRSSSQSASRGSTDKRGSSAMSGRRGSTKVDVKDVKNLKQSLREAQESLSELQSRLEESVPLDVVEQKKREIEALTHALEDEEASKRSDLLRLRELHKAELDNLELRMKGQGKCFDAEKQGYLNSISVLARTCANERQAREEERVQYVEQVASLQAEENWLENAYLAVQDKKFLDFNSEASDAEYRRLYQLYGQHLDKNNEEGLLELWYAIGQSTWKRTLRSSQLQLLLSRHSFGNLTFRVESVHHMEMGGTVVPVSEVRDFFSGLLSRIGTLRHLALIDCPVSPLDWDELSMPLIPFPTLESMALWHTALCGKDVVQLVVRLPSLKPCGFQTIVNGLSLHESCLDLGDYTLKELTDICQRKLWIWGAMISDVSRLTEAMQRNG